MSPMRLAAARGYHWRGRSRCGAAFYQPTILADVAPDALLCREETFGPVAGLVRFRDDAEAIALANNSRAGLASYLYTSDFDRAHRLSEALEFGMVGLNTGLISTEVARSAAARNRASAAKARNTGWPNFRSLKRSAPNSEADARQAAHASRRAYFGARPLDAGNLRGGCLES